VEASVAEAVGGEDLVAVSFSGGLDSSVIARCASRSVRVVLCSAFASGSRDAGKVAEASKELGLELKVAPLTREKVDESLRALELPFAPTLMDRSLWSLYYWVSKQVQESGARVMLLGQLADELFGGYAKYVEVLQKAGPGAAESAMEADFREYGQRGRIRDVGACGSRVEPRFPFGAARVVELAWGIPPSFKLREGARKAVLRRAAVLLGVPEDLAGAAKKAAQYSSGIQKLVAGSHF